jgi:hypothetical protein
LTGEHVELTATLLALEVPRSENGYEKCYRRERGVDSPSPFVAPFNVIAIEEYMKGLARNEFELSG